MTASASSGFGRLRSSTRKRGEVAQLKLFAAERPPPAAAPDRVQVRLKDFELHRPGNGVVAGSLANCGNNFNSMSSGEFDWVPVAKAPIGSTCSRRWCVTGYWIRAVSGAFTEYGLAVG
jgi:hypothetical protein